MAKTYKTAMGKSVDIDMLRLANESVIAVGNMRTNARGDELGPGGKVLRTRNQIMQEYHKLNTPVADNSAVPSESVAAPANFSLPTPDTTAPGETSANPNFVKPRGSFADSIAQQTEVTQELLEPTGLTGSGGVQRI